MAVRDRRQPADSPLYTRGELGQARRGRPARAAAGAGGRRRAGAIAPGSGRLELADWLASDRQPADRPRDGQPRLAAPVRPRARADAGQLRRQPASRRRHPELLDHLAVAVHGRRLVGQAADPPARAEPRLPAGVARTTPATSRPTRTTRWSGGRPTAGSTPRRIRDAMLAVAGKLDAAPPVGSLVARVGDGPSVRDAAVRPADRPAQRPVGLPAGRPRPAARTSLAAVRLRRPEPGRPAQRATTTRAGAGAVPAEQPVRDRRGRRGRRAGWPTRGAGRRGSGSARRTWRSCGRPPAAEEQAAAERFLADYAAAGDRRCRRAAAAADAWSAFCQALFASAEFLYLN